MTGPGDLTALQAAVGQRVSRIRRGRFSHPKDGTAEGGFLELTILSGHVLLLDIGSDWTLTVQPHAWADAFAEPPSADNRDFVERHGKWTAVDVSDAEATPMIGSLITSARLLYDEMGDVQGVVLQAGGAVLRASQWGGLLLVQILSV